MKFSLFIASFSQGTRTSYPVCSSGLETLSNKMLKAVRIKDFHSAVSSLGASRDMDTLFGWSADNHDEHAPLVDVANFYDTHFKANLTTTRESVSRLVAAAFLPADFSENSAKFCLFLCCRQPSASVSSHQPFVILKNCE
jgi:hypothetical protein